jgi:hypothetical protein
MRGRKWKKKGGGPVALRECISLPRAGPFGARLRIEEFTAEAFSELVGVRALREAEDIRVGAVSIERMPARAEREAFAEETANSPAA